MLEIKLSPGRAPRQGGRDHLSEILLRHAEISIESGQGSNASLFRYNSPERSMCGIIAPEFPEVANRNPELYIKPG
jgi:hypothetical protein